MTNKRLIKFLFTKNDVQLIKEYISYVFFRGPHWIRPTHSLWSMIVVVVLPSRSPAANFTTKLLHLGYIIKFSTKPSSNQASPTIVICKLNLVIPRCISSAMAWTTVSSTMGWSFSHPVVLNFKCTFFVASLSNNKTALRNIYWGVMGVITASASFSS